MKIITDTREQKPLKFKHPYITEVCSVGLKYGDYGCQFKDGYNPPFYFERKSIPDLFGTFGKGYGRFKKELIRAQKDKAILIIIIEGTLTDILRGCTYSKREPESLEKQLFTLMIKHWVPWVGCRNRTEMSRYITSFYLACGREYIRKKKER